MRRIQVLSSFFPLLLSLWGATLQNAAAGPSFFSTQWEGRRAWLQDPQGRKFLSLGVNAIGDQSYRAPNDVYYHPVKNQFQGDREAWVRSVLERLKAWNFNTIGGWSDEALLGRGFPHTYMLYLARGNPWDRVLDSVFSPDFEERVRENARKAARFKDDPLLIGYFLDNELPWWGEFGWRAEGQKSLLEKYAARNLENADREALRNFLKTRYGNDTGAFDRIWEQRLGSFDAFSGPLTLRARTKRQKADAEAWAGVVAERYFEVCSRILREVDPRHLILGARFAGGTPKGVVEACGRHCDVVSMNQYSKSGTVDRRSLDDVYALTKRPILLTEYSYSAMENQSGNPNTKGADVSVPTQKDRVEHYERFARGLLELPYLVGLHWFEWADESPQGRFDGEDCNYGLVDIQDREYTLLTAAHRRMNKAAETIHANSAVELPASYRGRPEADYRKGVAGAITAPSRVFLDPGSPFQAFPWSDSASGGKITVTPDPGIVRLDLETGKGWGCGATFPPNVAPFADGNLVDLRGYHVLEFEAFVPKDLDFVVFLGESGVAGPAESAYRGAGGADGESYSFPGFKGDGRWTTYRVKLEDLERRTVWGNQKGNQVLDLQALTEAAVYIPGHQGAGRILMKKFVFLMK